MSSDALSSSGKAFGGRLQEQLMMQAQAEAQAQAMMMAEQQEAYKIYSLEAHYAAALGDVEGLAAHVTNKPMLLNKADQEGKTPIFYAVANNKVACLRLLLDMKAKSAMQDSTGKTPLHYAAQHGLHDCLQILLEAGVKVTTKDQAGRTALHLATGSTDTACLMTLIKVAQSQNKKDAINASDNDGMTPLHWAGFHKRPNHTKTLLAMGAREDLFDIDKKTCLHWAAQNGSPMCVQLLLQSHSKRFINSVDKNGNSAMHLAAAGGHQNVLKVLARVDGVNLDLVDANKRTPLHWAAAAGHTTCIVTLLAFHVHPCLRDATGATPLDYARARAANEDAITALQDAMSAYERGEYQVKEHTPAGEDSSEEDKGIVSKLAKAFKKQVKEGSFKSEESIAQTPPPQPKQPKPKSASTSAAAAAPKGATSQPPRTGGHRRPSAPGDHRRGSESVDREGGRLSRKASEEMHGRRSASTTRTAHNRRMSQDRAGQRSGYGNRKKSANPSPDKKRAVAPPVEQDSGVESAPSTAVSTEEPRKTQPKDSRLRSNPGSKSQLVPVVPVSDKPLSRQNDKFTTSDPLPGISQHASPGGNKGQGQEARPTLASEVQPLPTIGKSQKASSESLGPSSPGPIKQSWSPAPMRKNNQLERAVTRVEQELDKRPENSPPPLRKRASFESKSSTPDTDLEAARKLIEDLRVHVASLEEELAQKSALLSKRESKRESVPSLAVAASDSVSQIRAALATEQKQNKILQAEKAKMEQLLKKASERMAELEEKMRYWKERASVPPGSKDTPHKLASVQNRVAAIHQGYKL